MQWIGVDGGGTKTLFELYDSDMNVLQRLRLPTCHAGQVGYDGMRAVLSEGVEALLAEASDDVGMGFGLAGYGQDARIRASIEEVVRAVAGGHPYELVNDVRAAWASSLAARDGAAVICGTGSIAYAVRGERDCRAGGWGFQIGDEGSGWWMGREVLRLFSRQADGRDPRGPLYDVVLDRLGLSDAYGLIAYVRDELQGDRTKVASLTRVLREAAMAGDARALDVYDRAASELAQIITAAARGVFDPSDPVPVGYVGGVFEGAGEFLLGPLRRVLPNGFELVEPVYGPAAGPCLLLAHRLSE